jgi:hypothetical protein
MIDRPTRWSKKSTCAGIKLVCKPFETSRRREFLSFNYHREVAALDPAQQDRLLDRATAARINRTHFIGDTAAN